jgi:hypothetical protein
VEDGFIALMPDRARVEIQKGTKVMRQGEWFFIPTNSVEDLIKPLSLLPNIPIDKIKNKDWSPRMATLPKNQPESSNHIVTKMLEWGGRIFVKGCVRHKRNGGGTGDHRFLRLGEGIFEAVKNTSMGDWSARGNVD